MTTFQKTLTALGIILTLGLLSFSIYQQKQNSDKQDAIEKQVTLQKELNDKIVRSQSEYATKNDLENFIKSGNLDLKTIQSDLNKLSATINSANKVIINSGGTKSDHLASTSTETNNPNSSLPVCKDGTVCPNVDPFGYLKNQQKLKLSEPFGDVNVPIGEVGFSSWQDKPWNINISPRQYQLITVVGQDENQKQYFYNKFKVTVDGKEYDIKINNAQSKQEYPSAKFNWWNPRLYLGYDAGINLSNVRGEMSPTLNLQIFSYGQFLNQPDFSILQLGLGYGIVSRKIEFVVTPFAYNIGKHLPLMHNVYLGPSLMISPNGDISVMGAVRVGL